MEFTVEQFLRLESIPGARLLQGSGNQTAIIRCISVMEGPVEDFVREHELVLTTATGLWGEPQSFLAFVGEIYASGAAALAVAVRDGSQQIPRQVVAFCLEKDFPLISLPWEYRFSEIMEETHRCIRHSELQDISFYEGLQKDLLVAYLGDGDLAEAAQIIARKIGGAVCITDSSARLRGASHQLGHLPAGEAVRLERFPLCASIFANGKQYGYLLAKWADEEAGLGRRKEYLEKYAAMPLTLWFDKEQVIHATRMKLKDDFIWSLAKGDFTDKEGMAVQAKLLGFQLDRPYTCIVGHIVLQVRGLSPEESLASNEGVILTALLEAGAQLRRRLMATIQQGSLILYLENPAAGVLGEINRFLDRGEAKLQESLPGVRCSWGIGEIREEGCDFHQGYINARLALELCEEDQGIFRSTYKDTSIYRVLSVLSGNGEIKSLAAGLLKNVVEGEETHPLDLLATFRCYLKNNGNISQTARDLHLHRQSLLYRLRKLEEATGLLLENHNDQFLLEICARLSMDFSQAEE